MQALFEDAPTDSTFRKLWEKKLVPNFDRDMIESSFKGKQRLEADKEEHLALLLLQSSEIVESCALVSVGRESIKTPNGFGYPKGSHVRAMFDRAIARLLENGMIDKEIDREFGKAAVQEIQKNCFGDPMGEGEAFPLGMEAMLGVFLLLGFGGVLAFALVVSEKIACASVAKHKLKLSY